MESNLRPLGLGEILDRTAQLYRTNFLVFAGIFAVYCGVGLVLSLTIIGANVLFQSMHVSAMFTKIFSIAAGGLQLLALLLLFGAAVAAISRAVAWVNLDQPATIRGAYMSILPRMGRYLWLMTLTFLIVYTPLALLYGGYFGVMTFYVKGFGTPAGINAAQTASVDPSSGMTLVIASVVFILLLIPVGIYTALMSLRYALALPACVVENTPARPSLKRSVALSKGSRGRIFVLGLLIGAIKIGLYLFTQIFFIIAIFKHHGQPSPGITAMSQIVAFFTNTFLGPIYATGITLFYYDQRIRKEGFDIEWMMEGAGMALPAPELTFPAEDFPAEDLPVEAVPANAPPDAPILNEPGSPHE